MVVLVTHSIKYYTGSLKGDYLYLLPFQNLKLHRFNKVNNHSIENAEMFCFHQSLLFYLTVTLTSA